MKEQRFVFGEAPELYDRARPGYPSALVDDVLSSVGPSRRPLRCLEVGAGTGKATVAFAERGVEILALEPSSTMAAVAIANCRRFPTVRVEPFSFEEWPGQVEAFDLVFAAQSWHWVDPAVRYVKAARALRPDGSLALFWHQAAWHGEPLQGELDRIYRRLVPRLHARNPGVLGSRPDAEDAELRAEILASQLFDRVRTRSYPWLARLTADGLIERLSTQSDHRLLADGERARLFEALSGLVRRQGGEVVVPHASVLALARVRGG